MCIFAHNCDKGRTSMKGILKTVTLMLAALLLWGCDKPQQEGPDVPQDDPKANFVLAVSDVTAVSCHFSVTPKDEQMPYVVMLVEKSDFPVEIQAQPT